MEALFLFLLNRSAGAAFLIAAVLLFRFLLRDAPKAFRLALWAVVAARLLCPYIPESRLSLMPDWTPVRPVDARAATPGNPPRAAYPIPAHSGMEAPAAASAPENGGAVTESGATPENNAPEMSLTRILSGVWLCGFCALLAYSLYSYFKLRRTVSASLPLADNCRICDDIPSPFVLGVLRPYIYVPSGLSAAELSCVLKHENAHIRRGDPCWALLAWLTACLYWFHPLVWLSYALFRRDMELACDEAAIRDMDAARRAAYAETLLNCGLRRGGISLAFGETGVKERVKAALRYRKPALWVTCAAAVVCVAAAVCFLTRPATDAQASAPSDNETTAPLSDGAESVTGGAEAAELLNVSADAESGKEALQWVRNDEGGNWENRTETRESIEFPGVKFQWTPESVTAIDGRIDGNGGDVVITTLFYGMPVWSVYFADLNGDGYSELCAMVSVGSGIIDTRIVAYDYKNGKKFELADRGYHDYTLSAESGVLTASMWRYWENSLPAAPLLTGTLRLAGENLVIVPAYPESIGNRNVQNIGYGVSPEWDAAARDAIIAHDKGSYPEGEFDAESHVILGMESTPLTLEAIDGGEYAYILTLYLMSLRESFNRRDGRFEAVSGRSGPVALTFRIENGTPTLTEYWEPRDGSYYWPDLREKFPASLTDRQLDTQTYIMGQSQEIYRQVVEHWNIDTALILDSLFDEFREPAWSSNPGDYLNANPLAVRELLYYGDYTRQYIQKRVGSENGLRGALMRLVLERLDALTWAEPGAVTDLSGLGRLSHATLTHPHEHTSPAPGTYPLSDPDKLSELAGLLRKAEPVQPTKCPFEDVLTLTDEYGNAVQLALAADSCGVYRFAGQYFRYAADDSALYGLFG